MKRFLIGLMAATMMAGCAQAAVCVRPTETEAFNVVGLKSNLMVGALACNQRDQYDQFMLRFQPHILAEQHVVDRYFGRSTGRASEDDYITNLANTQSQDGIAKGAAFCQSTAALFTTVLGIKRVADLDNFANANPPHQPIVLAACPLSPVLHRHHRVLHVASAKAGGSATTLADAR